LIIVHYVVKTDPGAETAASVRLERRILDRVEPIPPGAVWIDIFQPAAEEDRKVEDYLGCKVPTHADPDYTEPPEAHFVEGGVRYLYASVVSEPVDTPDIMGVTFIIAPTALVTVRYDEADSFKLFAEKLLKLKPGPALQPEAVAIGLVNTILNRSARALNNVGDELDSIGTRVFQAKGDQGSRGRIYSETLDALGREDEKISNLRESLVSLERVLLFLGSEGRADDRPKPLREAEKSALRDLESLEQDASFKAQKVQFLLDATLGLINLAQNDIIKLFSVLAVIFMPPTVIASIYGMNFKVMPELEWPWGYPMALVLMVCAAVLPYLFFRWKKWL
jgi:magnesium transporter